MKSSKSPTHLTVRKLPTDLARALVAERRRRGASLNTVVIDLLRNALGVRRPTEARQNGLEQLAGTWTPSEFDTFNKAVEAFEQIDEEIWK